MSSKFAHQTQIKKSSVKPCKIIHFNKLNPNLFISTRNSRYLRLGSQQKCISNKAKRNNFSQVLGKTNPKLATHYSQELLHLKQHKRTLINNNKTRKINSPRKRKSELQCQSIHKPKGFDQVLVDQIVVKQQKNNKQKLMKLLMHNYSQIRQPDYRRYLLQTKRQWQKCEIDKLFHRKYKNYMNFINLINFTNRKVYQKRKKRIYNVYVGKGNNSALVKQIFKNRFWWNIVQDKTQQNINFVWTQTKKQQLFSKINIQQSKPYQNQQQQQLQDHNTHINQQKPKKKRNSIFKRNIIIDHHMLLINPKDLNFILENQFYTKSIIKWKALRQALSHYKKKPIQFSHNHLEGNSELGNKKRLFINVKNFLESQKINPFDVIPQTFHISDLQSQEFNRFQKFYYQKQIERKQKNYNIKSRNIWIVKPGQNTNRGTGIQVFQKLNQIKNHIQETQQKYSQRTFIVQIYISPFLFFKRKFDIRCYLLITSCSRYKAYFYKDGYIRTSSKQFSFKKLNNKLIHLTNDAIQKKSDQYGKFQKGNKISFLQFQKYLDLLYPQQKYDFNTQIFDKMIQYTKYAVASTHHKIDQKRRQHGFQIFGLDFMIDQNFKPWLIQINTNPCLELSSPLLTNLIPSMLQNAFRIAIDPVFSPPEQNDWPNAYKLSCPQNFVENNRFQLIFDSTFNQFKKQQDQNIQKSIKKEQISEKSISSQMVEQI